MANGRATLPHQLQMSDIEADQLDAAQPADHQQRQNGAMAQTEQRTCIGDAEQTAGFFFRQPFS